jgi:hypothetical protein
VAYTCHLKPLRKLGSRGSPSQGSQHKKFTTPISTEKSWVVHICHPPGSSKQNKRIKVQVNLVKKQHPIPKIARSKGIEVWLKR